MDFLRDELVSGLLSPFLCDQSGRKYVLYDLAMSIARSYAIYRVKHGYIVDQNSSPFPHLQYRRLVLFLTFSLFHLFSLFPFFPIPYPSFGLIFVNKKIFLSIFLFIISI